MTELGVGIMNVGPVGLDSPGVIAQARTAEENGAVALHLSDHLLLAESTTSRYPFSVDGKLATPPEVDRLESLVTCAWILASTQTVRVGPSVLVLAQRQPLEVAKVTATIDALSGGRFFLGAGSGWLAEEQVALGYDFATRNGRFAEWVQVLRHAWSGDTSSFEGEFISVPEGIYCRPLPHGGRLIPVWTGGMTPKARRQSAEFADGWIAVHRADDPDLDALAARVVSLGEELDKRGRDRASFHRVVRLVNVTEANRAQQPELARRLAQIGFDEVVIDPVWPAWDGAAGVIRACGEALQD